MLRGGVIFIVALMSVVFLKRKLYKHHILGLFFVVLGISIIGVAAITNTSSEDDSGG